MKINPITCTDFYKTGHINQYPVGTEFVYSNFTPRSFTHAKMSPEFDGKVVVFGLQGFIKWFLIDTWNTEFFQKPKDTVIAAFKRRVDTSLGEGSVTVEQVEALHDLGYLPIRIKAIAEGERVNVRVPVFTVVNTLAKFYWLTNYLETVMSAELWKPMTVATIAYDFAQQLLRYVVLTGSDKGFAAWQIHDFSMRGMSGIFDASSVGAAPLLSSYGTDTIPGIDYLENYYNADSTKELIGGSVPATEHSVMCMGGKEDEIETFRRLVTQTYPSGIVSIVSDTWDFWKVITEYALELKDEILARKENALGMAKVVFRPDSGDPVDILCGTVQLNDYSSLDLEDAKNEFMYAELEDMCTEDEPIASGYFKHTGLIYKLSIETSWHDLGYPDGVRQGDTWITSCEVVTLSPAEKGAVECLWDIYGGTITDKGFKTLNQRVGLIYGDSITIERHKQILERLMAKGFSAGNVVYGVGSYTYQYITRDTFGFAMKATFGVVNGQDRELFKDPITDSGTKRSAKGLLRVEKEGNDYTLYDQQNRAQEAQGALEVVFEDGKLVKEQSLADIRRRLGVLV